MFVIGEDRLLYVPTCAEKGIRAELSNELRTFEQVLLHAEVNMTKEPQV